MKCPECGEQTRVISTRGEKRRRLCIKGGHRFTTVEVASKDHAHVAELLSCPSLPELRHKAYLFNQIAAWLQELTK